MGIRSDHIAVSNFPFSTTLKRVPAIDGTAVFLECMDFRVYGVQFSDQSETCISGAYVAEIERELSALSNQDIGVNEVIVKSMFSKMLTDFGSILWGRVRKPDEIVLEGNILSNYYILHGPEPFVGYLSYLIRLKYFDLFVGETWLSDPPVSTQVFCLPPGLYQQHLMDVLKHLQA